MTPQMDISAKPRAARPTLALRSVPLVAGILCCALAPPAFAQQSGNGLSNLFGIFSGAKSDAPQSTAPGSTGAMPTGSIPWSGEDGASGHPLMTASAIREAAANFNDFVARMWPDAARRNMSRENFERFAAGLAADLRIMDLIDAQ